MEQHNSILTAQEVAAELRGSKAQVHKFLDDEAVGRGPDLIG